MSLAKIHRAAWPRQRRIRFQQLGEDLGQIATYDDRMIEAARLLGFKTSSPA